jgi:peptidoglycan/xylan/chitin deacetylase (PgdA/CDA1 family)
VIPLTRSPLVLAYHGVGETANGDDPRRLIVSPRHLEAQVRLLKRLRYRFVTAGELAEGATGRTATLTFDDGWENSLTVAVPLLQRLRVRATFYLCPGLLGRQHPDVSGPGGRLLDERGARELCAAGMELGAHSMSHPDLRTLEDAALEYELEQSRHEIERLSGSPCVTFAYPFGFSDERVIAAAERAGYRLAFGWLPGSWRPLAAPRLPAPPRHGAGRLALKLMGARRRGR